MIKLRVKKLVLAVRGRLLGGTSVNGCRAFNPSMKQGRIIVLVYSTIYDHAEIQHAYINKAKMHPKPYPDLHTVNNWQSYVNHVIDVAKQ